MQALLHQEKGTVKTAGRQNKSICHYFHFDPAGAVGFAVDHANRKAANAAINHLQALSLSIAVQTCALLQSHRNVSHHLALLGIVKTALHTVPRFHTIFASLGYAMATPSQFSGRLPEQLVHSIEIGVCGFVNTEGLFQLVKSRGQIRQSVTFNSVVLLPLFEFFGRGAVTVGPIVYRRSPNIGAVREHVAAVMGGSKSAFGSKFPRHIQLTMVHSAGMVITTTFDHHNIQTLVGQLLCYGCTTTTCTDYADLGFNGLIGGDVSIFKNILSHHLPLTPTRLYRLCLR